MDRPAWDAALVEAELQVAGRTLMALHVPGCRPAGVRCGMPEIVRDEEDLAGWSADGMRPAAPSAREIAHMDRVFGWIELLPRERVVFRRIVGARALSRPGPDPRPLLSWRAIGARVGASYEAVRIWHGQAIGMVAARLNEPGLCAAAGGPVGGGPRDTDGALRRIAANAARRSGRRVRELA